jgi:hypothetical protein
MPDDATKDGGPGKLGDAGGAFLQASVKWPQEKGDPDVSLAFLLGWRMRRAVAWSAAQEQPDSPENETPGLNAENRFAVLCGQIDAAMLALTAAGAPSFSGAGGLAEAARTATFQTNLARLYEKDASFGRAAALGYDLHAFCAPPGSEAQVTIGAAGQTKAIKLLLQALATKFPPHAAHSVINSLSLWEYERDAREQVPRTRLFAQGMIWRSFLSGETAPKDVLHRTDYVGTADEMIRSVRHLLRQALGRGGSLFVLALFVLALIAAGVLALILSHGSTQGIVGGASSLIAALGVTWKGIGQFFGDAVAKAEQALWDSQVDWTIAYRATLTDDPGDAVAKKRTAHRKSHYVLWKQWDRHWPSIALDDQDAGGL